MNRYRLNRAVVLLVFGALAAAMLVGAKGPTTAPAPKQLNYLTSLSLDPARILPPPVMPGTQELDQELETVLRMQKDRTPAEVQRAKSESELSINNFSSVVGDWCTPDNLPLTAALLKRATRDAKHFSDAAKEYFGRKRPTADKRVQPIFTDEAAPGYPSGHATRALLMAEIIAQLDPDLRNPLTDRGMEIGWDRVIAGVHYPSDLYAGRVLGHAVYQALLQSPKFQTDLAQAKAEYAAAKKKFIPANAVP